jgi:hypothetical protein
MNCQQLAAKIESLQPGADLREVARLCLLIANFVEDRAALENQQKLTEVWQEMSLKIEAASDQHAAMTQELEELAASDPKKFTPDQVWVLVRALKVQSQVLSLYVGEPVLDV